MINTAILFAFTGGVSLRVADATRKKAPQTPHRENFNNLSQSVDDYDNVKIILLLVVRNHRDAPPIDFASRRDAKSWQVRPKDETAVATASQPAAGFYVVVCILILFVQLIV